MPASISLDQLKDYFQGRKKHLAYEDAKKLYDKLRTHADGECPTDLIHERRPSESEDTLSYRKKIYVPKTKNPINKVIQSLSKIRRSPDWSIQYPQEKVASIIEEESLEKYCEEKYPGHDSVTNWVFSHLLKVQLIDANAVVAVLPIDITVPENEYLKPVAMVFNSDQVIFFEDGKNLAILKSRAKSEIDYGATRDKGKGDIFYVITDTELEKWEQTADSYVRTAYLEHNKKAMPAFRVRGIFKKQLDHVTLQESRLSAMIPSLDEAAREYSDLQAAKVQHMFPLFWYYNSKNCNHCKGIGSIPNPGSTPTRCSHCEGSGKIKFSPYAHLSVEPPKLNEQATPMPPAGYIGRDVDIIKHQEESVKTHIYESLGAVNMQFLDQTPLNISGDAKNVDREELTNFVYSNGEDIVYAMDKIYWWINEWRYSTIVPDDKKRRAMLPKIPVPQNYDLIPSEYLIDEIQKAKTSKVNPLLVATLEREYAAKKLYTTPHLSGRIELYYELDPLPALTVDEKMSLLTNKGITQEDYVISANVVEFIQRAIDEDKLFQSRSYKEKRDLMLKYAKEKIKLNDAAAKLKAELAIEDENMNPEN